MSRATAAVGESVTIEGLDQDGRGVAHRDGKVVFIEGALIGERVSYTRLTSKARYETGAVEGVLRASSARVTPRCPSFGVCGGCSMQHLEARTQVSAKQRVLEDNLWHIARLRPESVFRPILGPSWGYRGRARLAVRHVPSKGGALIGFHQRRHSWIADMPDCVVLAPGVVALLPDLRELVNALSVRARLPQIEVAIGDGRTALVLRLLEPLSAADDALLAGFAERHAIDFWLQYRGPESATPFGRAASELRYDLPEFAVTIPFRPTDFTQVNEAINRVLVVRAVALLAPRDNERIADLFCGLGNFTLPIATRAASVVGVEGSRGLVERARAAARSNGLDHKVTIVESDLFGFDRGALERLGVIDKVLIDPPRDGALEVVRVLAASDPATARRVVYVSCNPASLARDAGMLVHQGGYVLKGAGVVNMFPHTSHVESIAVFERSG